MSKNVVIDKEKRSNSATGRKVGADFRVHRAFENNRVVSVSDIPNPDSIKPSINHFNSLKS